MSSAKEGQVKLALRASNAFGAGLFFISVPLQQQRPT